jgi:hypothetical protein
LTTVNSSPALTRPPQTLAHRIRRRSTIIARWLHIYLSMVSFAIVLFFSATGLTLNHPDWFTSREQTAHRTGAIPAALLHENGTPTPDKLGIVELLRKSAKVTGAVSDFRTDDTQISVSFKGPGYTADAFIDPTTGAYDLTETRSGFLAVVNDLHRGQVSGPVWSVVIDACAILLILVSLSGLVLILFLARRRTSGLLVAALGAALCFLAYRVFIP